VCCLAFVTIVRRFQRKRACKNGSFFRKQLIQLTRAQECNNKGWDENVRFSGSGPREHVDEVYFSHTWGTHSSAHASRVHLAVGLNRNDCYYGYSHVFVYVVKFVSMWVWQNFMIDGFVINDTIFFFSYHSSGYSQFVSGWMTQSRIEFPIFLCRKFGPKLLELTLISTQNGCSKHGV